MNGAKAERVILVTVGLGLVVIGFVVRELEAVAITFVTLGVAVFVFGVILPRVRSFSIGAKGLHAQLDQLARKVEDVDAKVETVSRAIDLVIAPARHVISDSGITLETQGPSPGDEGRE